MSRRPACIGGAAGSSARALAEDVGASPLVGQLPEPVERAGQGLPRLKRPTGAADLAALVAPGAFVP